MNNLSQKDQKTKKNVVHFPARNFTSANDSKPTELISFRCQKAVFAFLPGDKIICSEDFDADKFSPNTLVITEYQGKRQLTAFGSVDDETIYAVVIAYQRKVAQ